MLVKPIRSAKLLYFAMMLGGIFVLFHYRYILTLHQLFALILFIALLTPCTIIALKNKRYESRIPMLDLGKIEWGFLFALFSLALFEISLFGHTSLLSVITQMSGLIAVFLSKPKYNNIVKVYLLLALLASTHYMIYSPSFGIDTWRDVIQATQVIVRGGLKDLTIVHQAYPIPVVPLLYATYSIVAGLNTLWSSSVLGLLYLILLALWVYTLARHSGARYPHIAVILALTTPLVVVWSVGFIP